MKLDTLTAYLDHWADDCGDKVWMRALTEQGSEDYTWSEARRQINAVGAALESRFGNGVNMLLLSRNRPHWFLADLAIIRSGNATVGLFTTHPPATAQYIAEFTEAKVLFLGESPNWEEFRPVVPADITIVTLPGVEVDGDHLSWEQLVSEGQGKEPAYEARPDDMVSLIFTSGTTGLPKGVIQTHESNVIPIRRAYEFLEVREKPRYFSYLPLSHMAERQVVEYASLCNCGEVMFNDGPDTLMRDLQRAKPNVFLGVPRVWEQFQQAVLGKFGGKEGFDAAFAADPSSISQQIVELLGLEDVDFCLTGSAPIPPSLIEWWHALGLTLVEGFGQTEAMSLILSSRDQFRIGSVGKAIGEVECRITDEGELIVRAEGFTPGYYKQPEKTAELLRDGWLYTGDKAREDEDGFLYITGRVKDYFKTIQGKFVAPPPIEALFAENPYVEQQCLLGRGYSKTVMVTVLSEEGLKEAPEMIEKSLREATSKINDRIEKHARIGAVIISSKLWTVENEVLTPTLKFRREKIDELFGETAEQLAREAAESGQLLLHWVNRDIE